MPTNSVRIHAKKMCTRPRKNLPKTAAKLDILVHVVKVRKLVYEPELLTQVKDI